MAYKLDAGQQWLRDETTNELVGIKDSVDGEERMLVFAETNPLTGGSRFLINGSAVDGEWVTTPAIFKLLLNGSGALTMDSRDAAGVVSLAVYSEVLSGAVNQIGFPYSGDGAMAVRFNIPATATVQVI